jgi:hypothetical protein
MTDLLHLADHTEWASQTLGADWLAEMAQSHL